MTGLRDCVFRRTRRFIGNRRRRQKSLRFWATLLLVANGDVLWHEADNANQALAQMMGFDAAAMDALLLLSAAHHASGYDGKGDYVLHADCRLTCARKRRRRKKRRRTKPCFDALPTGFS